MRTRVAGTVLLALVSLAPMAFAQSNDMLAQRRYARALGLYEHQQFADALIEFRAALEMVPSPNARLYVARCLARTQHLAEAVSEFQHVILEADAHAQSEGRYGDTREAAQREMAEIEPQVGWVTVRVADSPVGLRLHVGTAVLARGATGEPIAVDPGTVRIEAQAPGRAPARREVAVRAGERRTIELMLESAAGSSSTVALQATGVASDVASGVASGVAWIPNPARTAAWFAVGVAGAATISWASLFFVTDAHYRRISASCTAGTGCGFVSDADLELGRTLQTATNVMMAVSIVAAVGSVFWVALSPPRVRGDRTSTRSAGARPPVSSVALTPAGIAWSF